MGGSHKGINSGNRGRHYGLMLLLAFGTALLGVMLLHRLRERRIFNLLVKEKDNQLISLQLLLQEEREYSKELKRKTEEMKTKIYTLRTQKMELDRRLMEMQSTIDSLKDEQKVMESALEEKQNEIKMRKEEIDSDNRISQLTAIKETLKQKEAEIEDLKHRLVNLTDATNTAEKDKSDFSLSKGNGGEFSQSTNLMDGENSTRFEDGSEKTVEVTDSREMTVEQLQDVKVQEEGFRKGELVGERVEEGQVKKNKISLGSGMEEPENFANSMETIVDSRENVLKLGDKSSDVKDGNEPAIDKHREIGKPEDSQDKNQEDQAISNGVKKLEIPDSRIDAGSRLRGKHGHVGRTKEKRWRRLAKSRDPASMRSRRFYRLHPDELRGGTESQTSNKGIGKREERGTDENQHEVRNARNLEDAEDLENRDVNTDPNQRVVKENEILRKSHNSPDRELQRNTTINGESINNSSYAEKLKLGELRQPNEDEASGMQQNVISGYSHELEVGEQIKEGNKSAMTDETEDAEPETESANGDSFRASTSNLEDKVEYIEEIDYSEF